MEKYCHGCGAKLQSIDENLEGYVDSDVLNRDEEVLCKRCFRMVHYGEFKKTLLVNDEFKKILLKTNEEKCLIVYVIDIFNFVGSIINDLSKLLKNEVFVVVNKVDILPKAINEKKIINFVKNQLTKNNIKFKDIELVSSVTGYNYDTLFNKISDYSKGKSVYVIGNANVGKSSFINGILRRYSNNTTKMISSSVFPGTTLKVIAIPFDENSYLYDTPGILDKGSMYNYLDEKNLKYVLPKKEIKPQVYQLNKNQSLFIGSLTKIDFFNCKNTSVITHFSNQVKVHRTKVEGSNEKFDRMIDDPIFIPKGLRLVTLERDFKKLEFYIPKKERTTIAINGYGYIDILKGDIKINVYVPKNVEVVIQDALLEVNNVKK
ncbi:MAG: ribosome biogenesis GTPase YqeH [Bacilli bacterium]|nr:ribosome biogenesis GTPase YqeH [Bacilli bacterium]